MKTQTTKTYGALMTGRKASTVDLSIYDFLDTNNIQRKIATGKKKFVDLSGMDGATIFIDANTATNHGKA